MKSVKVFKSKPVTYGAIAVASTAVVVGGYLGYKAATKPKVSTSTKPVTVQTTNPPSSIPAPATNKLANYDGTYSGTTNITQGLANATATVSGNSTISGTATYKGPFNASIPVTISGVVDANGIVSGTISGSGKVQGVAVTVSGTFNGNIKEGTATVNYTVKANGASASSSIVLKKQ